MQVSIVFFVRVQCRRKESSRSLSHLLMSLLSFILACTWTSSPAANRRPVKILVVVVLSGTKITK